MKTSWSPVETMVRFLIVLGWVLAMPMTVRAQGSFDINALPIDEENRFSNVGAFIIAAVDDDGNVVGLRPHCSGTLIHNQIFLTAGHCTGPGEFGIPPFIRLFVSLLSTPLTRPLGSPVWPSPPIPPFLRAQVHRDVIRPRETSSMREIRVSLIMGSSSYVNRSSTSRQLSWRHPLS
jgi:hypothetical protein